jgi:hypothetical protein
MTGNILQPGSVANHLATLSPGLFPQLRFQCHQLLVQFVAELLIATSGQYREDAGAIKIECKPQRRLARGVHCRTLWNERVAQFPITGPGTSSGCGCNM